MHLSYLMRILAVKVRGHFEERAARYAQQACSIAFTGTNKMATAYQFERRLFDNGHTATVLEIKSNEAMHAIKKAGLICLCTEDIQCDLSFNTDEVSLDEIHLALKEKEIIQ